VFIRSSQSAYSDDTDQRITRKTRMTEKNKKLKAIKPKQHTNVKCKHKRHGLFIQVSAVANEPARRNRAVDRA